MIEYIFTEAEKDHGLGKSAYFSGSLKRLKLYQSKEKSGSFS